MEQYVLQICNSERPTVISNLTESKWQCFQSINTNQKNYHPQKRLNGSTSKCITSALDLTSNTSIVTYVSREIHHTLNHNHKNMDENEMEILKNISNEH